MKPKVKVVRKIKNLVTVTPEQVAKPLTVWDLNFMLEDLRAERWHEYLKDVDYSVAFRHPSGD